MKIIDCTSDFQRSQMRYISTLRYLKHIQRSGKIRHLTRSQINALKYRLGRCLAIIRKYLKIAALTTGISAVHTVGLDAQCRMNRLPISNQASFATTENRVSPALVDIDNDGDFDLIVGGGSGTLRTYENSGGLFKPLYGLLNPFHHVDVGSFSAPTFLDIDEDGDVDVFIGGDEDPDIEDPPREIFYLRNEDGVFNRVSGTDNPLFDISPRQSTPSFADYDKDGDPDAFIGEYDGDIRFVRNDDGVFTKLFGAESQILGGAGSHSHPTFVDIDNDGDPDAFIGSYTGNIIYRRNDDGVFTLVTGAGNPFDGINVSRESAPAFADIDNDGDPDAYIGGWDGTIHFFRNDNNVFTEVNIIDGPFDKAEIESFSSTTFSAPTFGDIDQDGDEDAFLGTSAGTIRSFFNTNGIFTEVTGISNPFNDIDVGSFARPVLVDINGADSDTDLDLVVGNGQGKIRYYRNSNGVFTELIGFLNPLASVDVGASASPAFTDFDGDNDKDAFIGSHSGGIHYYRNDNGFFVKVTGAGNPFDGVDLGVRLAPAIFLFNASQALVGTNDGTIKEFRKIGSKYVAVTDSPFNDIDVGSEAKPSFSTRFGVVIADNLGHQFVFNDQGGRSNIWQGPITTNWHGPVSNWELMRIPEAGCDNVYVFPETVLVVDPTQIAEGRTLTIRKGGQFEVSLGAELIIDPN